MSFLKPPPRKSATDHLRDAVLRGEYAPGQRLVQEELASSFGVSRVPVREALRALEAEGLVEKSAGSGFVVASIDLEMLGQILRIRRVLEAEAIERLRGKPDVLDRLAERLNTIITSSLEATAEGDMDAVAKSHRAFNISIVEAVEDQILLRVVNNLWNLSEMSRSMYFWLGYLNDASHQEEVVGRLRKIVSVVQKHDIDSLAVLVIELREGGVAKLRSISEAQHFARARQVQNNLRALSQ